MISVMETQDYESTRDAELLHGEFQSEPRVPAEDNVGVAPSDDIPDGFAEADKIRAGLDIEGPMKIEEPVLESNVMEKETQIIRAGFDIEGSLKIEEPVLESNVMEVETERIRAGFDFEGSMKIEEPVLESNVMEEETERIRAGFDIEGSLKIEEPAKPAEPAPESSVKKSSTVETDKIRARFDSVQTEPCQLPIETKITTTTTITCSEYDSMLSMFDEFAATGKIGGPVKSSSFENGDMVWAKVKSHPWWPGQIFSEAFASASVRTSKRDGSVLVAFFGDGSYGWFVKDELVPFDPNFDEKSKQTHTKSFAKAVEEAVYESGKRSALGLACRCRNSNNFRPTDVEGYLAVDMNDYDPGVYSVKQIEKARESFKPKEVVDFIKQLAGLPRSSKHVGLDFFKKKAAILAYRKTVFEEFDDTYNQAFGDESQNRPVAKAEETETVRAPSSGELVIAEASGKTKNSALKPKVKKPKDQTKKDKYLFQRRDETEDSKNHTVDESQSTSPAQPVYAEGSLVNLHTQPPSNNLLIENPLTEESSGANTAMVDLKDTISKSAMEPLKDTISKSTMEPLKDTISKSTMEPLKDTISKSTMEPLKDTISKSTMEPLKDTISKSTVEPMKVKVQKRPSAEIAGDKPVKKKRSKIGEMVQKLSGENIPVTDGDKVNRRKMGPRFPKLLNDLHALAINPIQQLQKSKGKIALVRRVFLKFRSIVYQKSLPTSTPEIDWNESRPKEIPSLKPAKPLVISDDQTQVLLKRGPSDRQEEKRVAKKKKVDDVKSLVSEKKAAATQKPVKHEPPAKRPVKREPPVRVPNPTSLVLKFPQNGHLPSPYELRARFVRFGPLDHDQIRIFWKSSTCRVVFQYKSDAESAHRFAAGSSTLFGNTNVRCFLREMESDDPDPSDAAPALGPTPPLAPIPTPPLAPIPTPPLAPIPIRAPHLVEHPAGVQIKSILKRSGDDGGINGGSGGARGSARVKFELGGEESRKNNSSFNDGSYYQTMDYNSRNFQNFAPSNFANPSSQYSRPQQQINSHYNEVLLPRNDQNFNVPMNTPSVPSHIDVSQQMIALLTQCNDVVNRVTRFLGYVPYHPL